MKKYLYFKPAGASSSYALKIDYEKRTIEKGYFISAFGCDKIEKVKKSTIEHLFIDLKQAGFAVIV